MMDGPSHRIASHPITSHLVFNARARPPAFLCPPAFLPRIFHGLPSAGLYNPSPCTHMSMRMYAHTHEHARASMMDGPSHRYTSHPNLAYSSICPSINHPSTHPPIHLFTYPPIHLDCSSLPPKAMAPAERIFFCCIYGDLAAAMASTMSE